MSENKGPQVISLAALARGLSEPRLEAYRLHRDEPPKVVFGRYLWNIALCQALYHPLHFLEVPLRNTLHRVLAGKCRTQAWYDHSPSVLMHREHEEIRKAKAALVNAGKPEEPDRVVAELKFGFWTSLLGTDYEQKLWPWLLATAFPHIPRRDRTRKHIARRLHTIRQIRNDAFHYEKICMRPELRTLCDDILETIAWIEPDLSHIRPFGETFHDVYVRGPAAYEIEIVP